MWEGVGADGWVVWVYVEVNGKGAGCGDELVGFKKQAFCRLWIFWSGFSCTVLSEEQCHHDIENCVVNGGSVKFNVHAPMIIASHELGLVL